MPAVKVRTAAASHAGRRGHQEDACATVRAGSGELLVVADGMGGHAAGEVASGIAVRAFRELGDRAGAAQLDGEDLQRAARTANQRILDHAAEHEEASGMGSTLVAVGVGTRSCLVGHAGDSRAFLVTSDEVIPLTRDHSAVQEALDAGTLTEADAATSPYRHAILRNLGENEFPGLEVGEFKVSEGSIILLTSDGAHGFLTEAEILEHLCGTASLDDGLEHLLRLAYHNGSDDNMTLVAAEIGRFPRSRVRAQSPPGLPVVRAAVAKKRRSPVLTTAVVLLVGVLGALGWLLVKQLRGTAREATCPAVSATQIGVETPVPVDDSVEAVSVSPVPTGVTWATPMPTQVPAASLEPTPPPTATPEGGAPGAEGEAEEGEASLQGQSVEVGELKLETTAEGGDVSDVTGPEKAGQPGGEAELILEETPLSKDEGPDARSANLEASPTPLPTPPEGDQP